MNRVIENGDIKMCTLDEICYNLKKIDLLKIDVEGFELSVLKGAVSTLNKTNKILLEILEDLSNNFDYSPEDIKTFLKTKNFKLNKNLGNGNFLFEQNK